MLARIEMSCNNPDNGNFSGFVAAIQVGTLELMSNSWWLPSRPGPRLKVEANRFRLAGKWWPYVESKEYFGNWCWDAFWVEPNICVDFLVWLHGRRLMQIEAGEQRVFNLWHRDAPLDDARDFLSRYFAKPSTYS